MWWHWCHRTGSPPQYMNASNRGAGHPCSDTSLLSPGTPHILQLYRQSWERGAGQPGSKQQFPHLTSYNTHPVGTLYRQSWGAGHPCSGTSLLSPGTPHNLQVYRQSWGAGHPCSGTFLLSPGTPHTLQVYRQSIGREGAGRRLQLFFIFLMTFYRWRLP